MKHRFILRLALLISLIGSFRLSAADDATVMGQLHTAILQLQELRGPDKGGIAIEISGLWVRMERHLRDLQQASAGQRLTDSYAGSLGQLTTSLKRVRSDPRLRPDQILTICEAAEKDLAVKVAFAAQNRAAPFKDQPMEVATLKNSQPVPGCEVWYVPVAWADTPGKFERFPQESSPTNHQLPPGYYTMWTQKGGAKGAQTPVTVEGRDPVMKVDLSAP